MLIPSLSSLNSHFQSLTKIQNLLNKLLYMQAIITKHRGKFDIYKILMYQLCTNKLNLSKI
jgi:hypothetical protein